MIEKYKIERCDALRSLLPNGGWGLRKDTPIYSETVAFKPTDIEIQTEVDRLQVEYDDLAYSRARQAEYPDWGTQLEKIDDDGLTRWREEMIDPIKSKWPKDNSGPK